MQMKARSLNLVAEFRRRTRECRAAAFIPPTSFLRYFGRHHVNGSLAQFDWVGSGFSVKAGGHGLIRVDMDGGDAKLAILQGDQLLAYLTTRGHDGRRLYDLANATGETLTLLKVTEPYGDMESSQVGSDRPVSLFGLVVDPGVTLAEVEAPVRRVDFYGDSDSAAFGVDGSARDPVACAIASFGFENFEDGWIRGVQRTLQLDARVQAVSGIGVVRDAGGAGLTMARLVRRTVSSGLNHKPAFPWSKMLLTSLGSVCGPSAAINGRGRLRPAGRLILAARARGPLHRQQ